MCSTVIALNLWSNEMTYDEWMIEVNAKVIEITNGMVDLQVLPDWLSRDAYEDGLTAKEGAEECLAEAGWYDDEDDDAVIDEL
jgi:hypothetical protein